MRFLIKISIPVEAGNAAIQKGTLPQTIQAILAEQKPEVAYFYADGGRRTGLICVDLTDASQIPAIAEPWFLAFNAAIDFQPVMTPEDLAKAGPAIGQAVQTYGHEVGNG